MVTLSPAKTAGLLSLLSAVTVLGIWYILLFVAQPECDSVIDSAFKTAHYLLVEEETTRYWFIWLAVVPVVSIVVGICYLSGVARAKGGAITLLALCALLGASSFMFLNWELACWVLLPCYWGYLCVRQA